MISSSPTGAQVDAIELPCPSCCGSLMWDYWHPNLFKAEKKWNLLHEQPSCEAFDSGELGRQLVSPPIPSLVSDARRVTA